MIWCDLSAGTMAHERIRACHLRSLGDVRRSSGAAAAAAASARHSPDDTEREAGSKDAGGVLRFQRELCCSVFAGLLGERQRGVAKVRGATIWHAVKGMCHPRAHVVPSVAWTTRLEARE